MKVRNQATMYTLRKSKEDDASFIYEVVETTMRKFALETWGVWLEKAAKEDAIEGAMQGVIQIVYVRGEKAGTLQVVTTDNSIVLKQIYILPEFQNQGIGRSIIQDMKSESDKTNLPITLSVLQVNPASDFYLKLGFTIERETKERIHMRYVPL